MKPHRHIRNDREKARFMEGLAKMDFNRQPITFYYEPYKEDKTRDQENKYHAMIRDVSKQIDFPRGSGEMRSVEDWKRILMSAYRIEQGGSLRAVPGLRAEVVMLGKLSTSELKSHEASDFIEFIYSEFPDVKWSE